MKLFKRKESPEYVLDYLYCDKCGARVKLDGKTKRCDSCSRSVKEIAQAASKLSKKQFAENYFTANSIIKKSYITCWCLLGIMLVFSVISSILTETWFGLVYFGIMIAFHGLFLIITQITHERLFLIPAMIFSTLGLFGFLEIFSALEMFIDLKMLDRDYKEFKRKTNEMNTPNI